MSKRSNSKSGKPGSGSGNRRSVKWVNVSLQEDDYTWLEDNYTNFEQFATWLSLLVETGFRFSSKWDDKNNCCVSSISQTIDNCDYILTGRGSNAYSAGLSAMYRHFVMLEQNWEMEITGEGGVGLFG